MTEQRTVVARSVDQRRRDSSSWHLRLPEDVQRETARRLALFCAVGAGTWAIGVTMENVLRPTSVAPAFPWPGNLVGGIMIALLTIAGVYVWRMAALDSEFTLNRRFLM